MKWSWLFLTLKIHLFYQKTSDYPAEFIPCIVWWLRLFVHKGEWDAHNLWVHSYSLVFNSWLQQTVISKITASCDFLLLIIWATKSFLIYPKTVKLIILLCRWSLWPCKGCWWSNHWTTRREVAKTWHCNSGRNWECWFDARAHRWVCGPVYRVQPSTVIYWYRVKHNDSIIRTSEQKRCVCDRSLDSSCRAVEVGF